MAAEADHQQVCSPSRLSSKAQTVTTSWYIEGQTREGGPIVRAMIGEHPLRVGRQVGLELTVRHDSVSRLHAELCVREGALWIRDCGSSNGTFVNRKRITETVELHPGDVIHFAHCEFVVGCTEAPRSSYQLATLRVSAVLPASHARDADAMYQLVREEHVRTVYEPIVEAATQRTKGLEVLGRGTLDHFFESPGELFALAKPLGLETALSQLFRRVGVAHAPHPLPPAGLFLNVHPAELDDIGMLLDSFACLRQEFPAVSLVAEFPESAATDDRVMRLLRERLRELGVGLAYDDFGAGQARLSELARVPPDYLKFDKSLLGHLAVAEPALCEMVAMLIDYAHGQGVECVAEGIETPEDAAVACRLGFDDLQGYLFGALGPSSCSTATSS